MFMSFYEGLRDGEIGSEGMQREECLLVRIVLRGNQTREDSNDLTAAVHWALGRQFLTAHWIQGNNRSSVTPRISGAIFAVNHGIFSASHVDFATSNRLR
jgi:hypothetical protein